MTTWTDRATITTAITDRTPVTTTWDQRNDYLLQEDTFYLLLEDGGKIVLSGVTERATAWTDRTPIS